jgi:hypothetical protein
LLVLYTYTLTFACHSLDETRARDLLEQQFGVRELTIRRASLGTARPASAQPLSPRKEAIIALLADDRPRRRDEIAQSIGVGVGLASQYLGVLVERGEIQRLRQGVYGSLRASPTAAKAMARAHTAPDRLRNAF